MTYPLENKVLISSLEAIFQEASRDIHLLGKVSLSSLSHSLCSICSTHEVDFRAWGSYLYWFSCLLLWKSQWLLLQRPEKLSLLSTDNAELKEKRASVHNRVRAPRAGRKREVSSLVMYLEHKTFKMLSLERSTYTIPSKLNVQQLEELYRNLFREKEKKKDLKHISLHLSQRTAIDLLPEDWSVRIMTWSEKEPINVYWKNFCKEQRLGLFQDLLFRQKKGELTLVQEKPNDPIYIRRALDTVVSYG